eukprot:8329377-Lingulodinium_polyedra.AAC.1
MNKSFTTLRTVRPGGQSGAGVTTAMTDCRMASRSCTYLPSSRALGWRDNWHRKCALVWSISQAGRPVRAIYLSIL